jgi:hypothetical protein
MGFYLMFLFLPHGLILPTINLPLLLLCNTITSGISQLTDAEENGTERQLESLTSVPLFEVIL